MHGADSLAWPAELKHPDLPAVAAFREEHAEAVEFHRWLQWVLDEQLAATQLELRRAGMGLGVMTDLAVGVHWSGADAWSLQETYAAGVTVGAPPDPYNQNGQDWQQPPWRPDRLAETAYEPFRRLVAAALRNAGGLRVDHVIGLFRLWWIPEGCRPDRGHLRALRPRGADRHPRAGGAPRRRGRGRRGPRHRRAVGAHVPRRARHPRYVDPVVRDGPRRRSADRLPAERWREWCLASVTTHDLPPTAGYLAGDHVRLRDSLGLLTRPVEEELAVDAVEREAWLGELRRVGLLSADGADVPGLVEALHAYLTRTPSRLRCLALTDAVGDRRTQNQPGTIDEYPNWRVPLSGPDGRPILLDDVFASERAARLCAVLLGSRPVEEVALATVTKPRKKFADFAQNPCGQGVLRRRTVGGRCLSCPMSASPGERFEVEDLDPDGVLCFLRDLDEEARRIEAFKLKAAAHWADLHPATVDTGAATPDGGVLDADELLGGEGTPAVAAFTPEDIAVVLQISPSAAAGFIADALDLRHRLPALWRAVMRLEVPAWLARRVAQQTRRLPKAGAKFVDETLAARTHGGPG